MVSAAPCSSSAPSALTILTDPLDLLYWVNTGSILGPWHDTYNVSQYKKYYTGYGTQGVVRGEQSLPSGYVLVYTAQGMVDCLYCKRVRLTPGQFGVDRILRFFSA